MSSHVRVLALLIAMLLSCCGLAVVCGVVGYTHGMHTLAFMAAEVRLSSYVLWFLLCLWPSLESILVHNGFAFNSLKKETLKTNKSSCFPEVARLACFLSLAFNPRLFNLTLKYILVWRREWEDKTVRWCWNQMTAYEKVMIVLHEHCRKGWWNSAWEMEGVCIKL